MGAKKTQFQDFFDTHENLFLYINLPVWTLYLSCTASTSKKSPFIEIKISQNYICKMSMRFCSFDGPQMCVTSQLIVSIANVFVAKPPVFQIYSSESN